MSFTRTIGCVFAGLLVGCAADAAQPALSIPRPGSRPASQPAATANPVLSRPLLLHLPGIGGLRSIDQSLVRGFVQGGFSGDVQIYDWTDGDGGIDALHNYNRNRREAQLIADRLVARHRADPHGKIFLTCHSGGAGLAVWALEDLPPDVGVDVLLFMSPALSPTYDLSRALRHVKGRAYVFTSLSDNLVLGYGTRLFGTIDGIKTDAAGRVGFVQPATANAEQYRKLIELPYQSTWTHYHNLGDHVGGMTRAFGMSVLTPLLLSGVLPITPTVVPIALPDMPHPLPLPTTVPDVDRKRR